MIRSRYSQGLPIVIVIIFCYASLTFAQDKEYNVLDPLDNWREKWIENVPLAGGIRAGVMTGADESSVDPNIITIFIPESNLTRLCVEIVSQDGRYRAKLEYDVKDANKGPLLVRLPTKYESELKEYRKNEISVLAEMNQACGDSINTFVVACWGNCNGIDDITIFVNSSVPTEIMVPFEGQQCTSLPCNTIENENTIGYNKYCNISSDIIIKENSNLVIRQRYKNGYEYIPLPLKFP